MLAASHAITGAIIASASPTPAIGYIFATISHPLLDLFPHWDFNIRNKGRPIATTIFLSLLDASIGFAAGIFLFGDQVSPSVLLLTMFLAQLPDWLEAPYHVFKWNFPPFSSIKKIQHIFHWKLAAPWGIITQLLFLAILILSANQ